MISFLLLMQLLPTGVPTREHWPARSDPILGQLPSQPGNHLLGSLLQLHKLLTHQNPRDGLPAGLEEEVISYSQVVFVDAYLLCQQDLQIIVEPGLDPNYAVLSREDLGPDPFNRPVDQNRVQPGWQSIQISSITFLNLCIKMY